MKFRLGEVGRWGPKFRYEVTREQTTKYAAATHDGHRHHLDGTLSPPVFACVAASDAFRDAMKRLAPGDLEKTLLRGVHGEQDIHIRRPIVHGATLWTQSRPLRIRGVGAASIVVIQTRTTDGAGDVANEQYFTTFFRNIASADTVGRAAPSHAFPEDVSSSEPLAAFSTTFDPDQTLRYAEASGDLTAYHVDDRAARSVGLPGIIVHGLCTLAAVGAGMLEACGGDPRRLRRLGCRFSAYVLPKDVLRTTLWALPASPGTYAFVTVNQEGVAVLTDGVAATD